MSLLRAAAVFRPLASASALPVRAAVAKAPEAVAAPVRRFADEASKGDDSGAVDAPTEAKILPHETRVLEGGNVTHPWNRYLVADDDSDNFGYETAIVRAPTSSLASEVAGRRALIYQPSKDALTSGRQQTKHWTLKFDHKEYWSSPLMGYMSAADTTTQLTPRLRFESAEEAVLFCRRNGWDFEVRPTHQRESMDGKKDYGFVFLREAVRHHLKTKGARKGRLHYANSTGKSDSWVNMRRSKWGKNEWKRGDELDGN